jgi:hypothetical protein
VRSDRESGVVCGLDDGTDLVSVILRGERVSSPV